LTPILSIIIATYNSDKKLSGVLKSLYKQNLDKKQYQIVIIDGGSTDTTLDIAKDNNCLIIHNPQIQPVYAKYLGFIKTNTKYIMYLDHDEVLEQTDSLKRKINLLVGKTKIVLGDGYKNPEGYGFINRYINEFGDPFSFFIYRLSKDYLFFVKDMKNQYSPISEDSESISFDFFNEKRLPIIELCAGGTLFDSLYVKKSFPETKKQPNLIPHFFYLMIKNGCTVAISKNNYIVHYSAENLEKYISKIIWRIKNNIFHTNSLGQAGFSGRQTYMEKSASLNKYLFIPYSLLIVPSLIDSIRLSISRKDMNYLCHSYLCFVTAVYICYFLMQKTVGVKPALRSYDEKTEVKET